MDHQNHKEKPSYRPLYIIIGLITLVTTAVALKDVEMGMFSWEDVMMNFMAGFFLVFSGFKLLDIKGFKAGYSTYDILAKKVPSYGYVYPFIELGLGLAYLTRFMPDLTNWVTLIVMLFSSIGVAQKIMSGSKFQCACLGTMLKVPLTKITLIEDLGMALMALAMIIFN